MGIGGKLARMVRLARADARSLATSQPALASRLIDPDQLEDLPDEELPRRYTQALRLAVGGDQGQGVVYGLRETKSPPRPLLPPRQAVLRRFGYLREVIQGSNPASVERARCAADVVHFVEHWAWTYDPRLPVGHIPFDLFPRQREFMGWLKDREKNNESGLVEKSRDQGLTWMASAHSVHGWIFRSGYAVGFGSRKRELVDKLGDPDSILEKVRLLLDMLPPFLLPKGYSRDKHAGLCKIVNPENGSSITGEGGDQIGRGGRKTTYFVDEAAFVARPKLIDSALSQTTNVRIDISTPNGPGTPFTQKRQSGKIPVWTMHWRDDPRRDDAWYAKQKEIFGPTIVAQEIDIDHSASVEGICIPAAWVQCAIELKIDGRPLPMGPRIVCGLDVSGMGSNETVLCPRSGPFVFSLISWKKVHTTETAMRAMDHMEKNDTEVCYYDIGGLGIGVKAAWDSLPQERKPKFRQVPVNNGNPPTNATWPGGKSAKSLFVNLRAEAYWGLRRRFERTWEYVEKGIPHKPEDMISIPRDPELIAQLSMPLAEWNSSGKIKIESKEDMAARGIKSPDRADSLALAFCPINAPVSWGLENLP